MKDWAEFIKSITRPFIIICSFIVYVICIMSDIEVPYLLSVLISAVIAEYFTERAFKRLKEK